MKKSNSAVANNGSGWNDPQWEQYANNNVEVSISDEHAAANTTAVLTVSSIPRSAPSPVQQQEKSLPPDLQPSTMIYVPMARNINSAAPTPTIMTGAQYYESMVQRLSAPLPMLAQVNPFSGYPLIIDPQCHLLYAGLNLPPSMHTIPPPSVYHPSFIRTPTPLVPINGSIDQPNASRLQMKQAVQHVNGVHVYLPLPSVANTHGASQLLGREGRAQLGFSSLAQPNQHEFLATLSGKHSHETTSPLAAALQRYRLNLKESSASADDLRKSRLSMVDQTSLLNIDTTTPTHPRGPQSFPMVLHRVLAELELVPGGLEIATFMPDGKSFQISNHIFFEEEVLPVFFPRMAGYASFQRQLNLYSFKRDVGGNQGAVYRHVLFIRELPALSSEMKRAKKKAKPRAIV